MFGISWTLSQTLNLIVIKTYLKLQILLKIKLAQTSEMKQMMQIISFKYIIIVKVGLKVKSKKKRNITFKNKHIIFPSKLS
jgi:hypothetical protein